jgi:hypothetical protein
MIPDMPDTDDTRPISSTGHRFSDDIRQLAYEIWAWEADRNATRTQQILAEECRSLAEAGIDPSSGEIMSIDEESIPIPTARQVQRWARDGDWAQRSVADMARIAPKRYQDANTRLFAGLPQAQKVLYDIIYGEYDNFRSPGILAIKHKAASEWLTFAGVGTAAGLMPVALPQSAPQALTGDETPQELARRTRDALRALRDGR